MGQEVVYGRDHTARTVGFSPGGRCRHNMGAILGKVSKPVGIAGRLTVLNGNGDSPPEHL